MPTEIWLFIVGLLAAACAYFLKRIMDNTDKMADDVSDMKPKVASLWNDVSEIKPKVTMLWTNFGELKSNFENFKKEVSDLSQDIEDMKPKVADLWTESFSPSSSPRQLNEKGKEILDESGIKQIIDEKKSELLATVKKLNPGSKYDAEKIILKIAEEIPEKYPEFLEPLKEGAFQSGVSLDTVLYTGGIYLRNLIFPDLGFDLEDLDNSNENRL